MQSLRFWHHHGGISVPDLDAAIAWYRNVLGFELETRFPIPTTPVQVAILKNGPLRIELFQADGAKPLPQERREPNQDLLTHGNKHVSFAVDDVKRFVTVLRERGADIVWVTEFEFGANIFIRDNAGNLLEFVQAAPPVEPFAAL
jgi:methylmalonyl-CoA/ethylmalonyl-CoA epimerase